MRPLLTEIRGCRACEGILEPRPVLVAHPRARLLLIGQAPGARVHASGVTWDDASGDRLRDWMGVDKDTFYDERRVAQVPMAFCYPGRGKSGDNPPPPACAELWHARLLALLERVELTVLIGAYAQARYLGDRAGATLTETVRAWRTYGPHFLPLPHPSPRNGIWLRRNPWFEEEVLPALRRACASVLGDRDA